MPHMARNRHMIAIFHPHGLSSLEFEDRFPAQDYDPFVFILIVPKTRRAVIRLRNNALDLISGSRTGSSSSGFGKLRQITKQIFQPELSCLAHFNRYGLIRACMRGSSSTQISHNKRVERLTGESHPPIHSMGEISVTRSQG